MGKVRTSRLTIRPSIMTPAVAELVAMGAAIGANCEPCFKYHYNEARKLGVSRDDMVEAVGLADRVKRAPAQNMLALAGKILGADFSSQPSVDPSPGRCCSNARETATSAGCKCCDRAG